MKYESFIERVATRGGFDNAPEHFSSESGVHSRAAWAVRATLITLAERVSRAQATELADELPEELAPDLLKRNHSEPEIFEAAEFCRRVADREGLESQQAEAHVRAVMAVLRDTGGGEFDNLAEQLSSDYNSLLVGQQTG